MTVALIVYGYVAAVWLALASIAFVVVHDRDRTLRRRAARAVLIAPVWPIIVFVGLRIVIRAAVEKDDPLPDNSHANS